MHCDVCGFHRELWTDGDLRSTLDSAGALADNVMGTAPLDVAVDMAEILGPLSESASTDLVDSVHQVMHRLHLAGRLHHLTTAPGTGTVVQLSRSAGGVPKLPVDRVTVGLGGLEGDVRGNRRHHGRPWQAVCLWSAEIVEGLRQEGHPIGFGSAGENVTVRGLDWSLLSPGVRLLVGTTVVQVSAYAIPCAKNAQWFSDGDSSRMAQEVRPGASRLYASVLVPGVMATGDAVVVEPVDPPIPRPRPEQQRLPL